MKQSVTKTDYLPKRSPGCSRLFQSRAGDYSVCAVKLCMLLKQTGKPDDRARAFVNLFLVFVVLKGKRNSVMSQNKLTDLVFPESRKINQESYSCDERLRPI